MSVHDSVSVLRGPAVGPFRFYFADESWEWSAKAAQIHGYRATEMRPTTELVMSYEHPDDHAKIAATLAQIRLEQAKDAQRLITEAVAEIAEKRGVIEQCKGILVFAYRIDAERAFDLLRWRSQFTNTKLIAF